MKDNRYVAYPGKMFKDGRGLGNQMFNLAVVVYVSELSGRKPVVEKVDEVFVIEKVFNLSSITKMDSLPCPCHSFGEGRALSYDQRVEELGQPGRPSESVQTILLSGFFQSWKYTRSIERRLREIYQFNADIRTFAENYLAANSPPGWTQTFVRVAIHIRRGDNFNKEQVQFGYTVPNASYFERAMDHFTKNYGRVQFIALSTDKDWTLQNIVVPKGLGAKEANVTYAFGNAAGQDMALMSLCDHVIISTGTFGWWGAFLAKGSTVYYSNWPRPGSGLYNLFTKGDFFPPAWIPME